MSTRRGSAPALKATPRGVTIAFLGDSITAGGTATFNYGDSFPLYACLASAGRLISVGYHGVGGETTVGGLTRLQTALAKRPTYVHILYGTNDIGQGVGLLQSDQQILQTWSANMTVMVNRVLTAGSVPILGTIPPNNAGANSARTRVNQKANVWLRRFCMVSGIVLVDYYTLLAKDGIAESPGGNYKTIYALDGTHPNAVGAGAMGSLLWSAISGSVQPRYSFPMCTDLGESGQLLWVMRNTLWTGQTGAPGVRPDNCSAVGTAGDANSVYSLVTNSTIPGNSQRMAFNSSATALSMGVNTAAQTAQNAIAGDIISISGLFISDGAGIQCQLLLAGNTYKAANISRGTAFGLGAYYMEVPMPSTGSIAVQLMASTTTGIAAQADFGYPSVVNVTQTLGETTPINAN